MSNPLRRLYAATLALAEHKRAPWALFAVSAAESSFFPVPPDALLIPMCVAKQERAWEFALLCTLGSVLGALVGYAIGAVLWQVVGLPLLEFYHLADKAAHLQTLYQHYGAWVILLKGLTPIPFKLVTIVSGMAHFPLLTFVVLCTVTRGVRFFAIAALIRWKGTAVKDALETHLEWLAIAFVAAILAGVALFLWLA